MNPTNDSSINKYPRNGLVSGYAAFDEKQIGRGVRKLTKVLTGMMRNQNDSIPRDSFTFNSRRVRRVAVSS
jgi:hypothetical protein